MALCVDFDVPILLHTNEPLGHNYAGKTSMTLKEIYRFLKAYPENRIVLAHWGGGILFYAFMKKEVKETLQNTWFDTAASPYLFTPDIYRIAGEAVGFNKILFGSDHPLIRQGRIVKSIRSANLSEEAKALILGENARRLLGLP